MDDYVVSGFVVLLFFLAAYAILGRISKKREPDPPSPDSVALRALCLGALIMRAEFEILFQNNIEPDTTESIRNMASDLDTYLSEEELVNYQSRKEKKLFSKPLGSWSESDLIYASQKTESLGVLLWSLSFFEDMPAYDIEFNQEDVLKRTGLTNPKKEFLDKIQPRSSAEIIEAQNIAERQHKVEDEKISAERHLALNWLCGYSRDWDSEIISLPVPS